MKFSIPALVFSLLRFSGELVARTQIAEED